MDPKYGVLKILTSKERVHLKLCKHVLRLKNSAPNFCVYGELGRYHLSVTIKLKMIKYWCRLIHGKENKLSSVLFKLLSYINYNNYGFSNWMTFLKNIFDHSGMSNIWQDQNADSENWLINSIELRLLRMVFVYK